MLDRSKKRRDPRPRDPNQRAFQIILEATGQLPKTEPPAEPAKNPHAVALGHPITGNPDPKHINTSYIERQNLTMRMSMRRFTRLTNAFSKKLENHIAAIAIHLVYYNFVRIHQTLRVTPAMAAGVTDRLWEIEDLVALLD
jgi:hypothetical protein